MEPPKASENSERLITALYDSYIKTCLRNRSRTLCRRYYKQKSRGCLINNPDVYAASAYTDVNHIADTNVIDIDGLHCEVQNDRIYEALTLLPKKQLATIVAWYWYGLRTQEIARHFHVTDRTVRNWHCRALLFLQEKLGKV